jgi:hypothetical protein
MSVLATEAPFVSVTVTNVTVRPEHGSPQPPPARSTSEVHDLLADPTGDAFSPITGDPLVVIDLDRDNALALSESRHRPCITVGVHTKPTALPVAGVAELDVLLTAHDHPPRPWVQDGGGRLERIATNVTANPHAAVTFTQLLRFTDSLDPLDALVAESLAYSMLLAGPEFHRWIANRPTPRPAHGPDPVRVARSSDELEIRLNRPEVHNAYSAAMRDALTDALAIPGVDPTIHHVVLCGDGPSFCSGGDLREFGTTPDPATAHLIRTTRSPARLLTQLADRVTARLHGACVGAGIELAAFADHVTAHPDSRFQLPETTMGLIPGAGGTVSLSRRIGRQRTTVLGLSADRIDAAHAFDWGLVDEITE